jgi:hypothetical protein
MRLEVSRNLRKDVFNILHSLFVSVQESPAEYIWILMPLSEAERAAQFNLELFRMKKSDGSANKPPKIWRNLNHIPKTTSQQREKILRQKQSFKP